MQTISWKWWALGGLSLLLTTLLLTIIALGFLPWVTSAPARKSSPPAKNESRESKLPTSQGASAKTGTMPSATLRAKTLQEAWSGMSSMSSAARAELLRRLTRQFQDLPMHEAEEAILAELESGRDAQTGLEFLPSEDGLDTAPTWRVYLLDLLGRINPKTAAQHARSTVFSSSGSSADEWAVSMRSVLQSYPPRASDAARNEISSLLDRMLARDEWRAAPSAGMLEALDFVAHTKAPASQIPVLAAWLDQSGGEAQATAVQIAIERTMATRGDEMLARLAKQEAPSTNANALLASAMARADFRQPPQKEAVVQFLRRQTAGSEAAVIFFEAFPLHRFSVAPGLAGVPRIPDASDLRASDEAALAAIEVWSADPSLAGHSKEIAELAEKLRELTGQK